MLYAYSELAHTVSLTTTEVAGENGASSVSVGLNHVKYGP